MSSPAQLASRSQGRQAAFALTSQPHWGIRRCGLKRPQDRLKRQRDPTGETVAKAWLRIECISGPLRRFPRRRSRQEDSEATRPTTELVGHAVAVLHLDRINDLTFSRPT